MHCAFTLGFGKKPLPLSAHPLYTCSTVETSTPAPISNLSNQRAILTANTVIAQLLLRNLDWRDALDEVLQHLGLASGVDRAYIHQQIPHGDDDFLIRLVGQWTATHGDDYEQVSFLLSETPFADWVTIYAQNQPIATPVADLPPAQRQSYEASGVKSFASLPIWVNGQLWGVIGLNDNQTVRTWDAGEIENLMFTVAMLSAAIEYEQLQKKLEKSAQLKTFGHLSASIAHDFKNILATVQMHAAELAHHTVLSEKGQTYLDRIQLAADRGTDLTAQILNLASGNTGDGTTARIDIHALIMDNVQLLQPIPSKKIKLTPLLFATETTIKGVATRLQQVFMNLMINAIEAMDADGGTLSISTHNVVEVQPASDIFDTDTLLVIVLEDDGPGMPRAVQQKIFEPFFTTKSTGHGLGLSATRGFVLDNNGSISVQSTLGKGTRFTLKFPVYTS